MDVSKHWAPVLTGKLPTEDGVFQAPSSLNNAHGKVTRIYFRRGDRLITVSTNQGHLISSEVGPRHRRIGLTLDYTQIISGEDGDTEQILYVLQREEGDHPCGYIKGTGIPLSRSEISHDIIDEIEALLDQAPNVQPGHGTRYLDAPAGASPSLTLAYQLLGTYPDVVTVLAEARGPSNQEAKQLVRAAIAGLSGAELGALIEDAPGADDTSGRTTLERVSPGGVSPKYNGLEALRVLATASVVCQMVDAAKQVQQTERSLPLAEASA
jgi:hypothetical protein